jgi:putative ABC transport system substrate-binding protein
MTSLRFDVRADHGGAAVRAGLVFLNVPTTADHRRQLMDLALRDRLPTMFEERLFADAGGLMAYGPSFSEIFRQAANRVARILQGAKPSRSAGRTAH